MKQLQFTEQPNKRMWAFTTTLVTLLGLLALLIACAPQTIPTAPTTTTTNLITTVVEADDDIVVWSYIHHNASFVRIYDKKLGYVCYALTENDYGSLKCFDVGVEE